MDARIAAALGDLLGYVKQTADFAAEQAPLVAREIVWWGIADGVMSLLFLAACAYGGVRFWRWFGPIEAANERQDTLDQQIGISLGYFAGIVASAFAGTIGVFAAYSSAAQIVMALFAPRLFVLQRIADMLGKP